jgi:protein O-mannosyl-transferase
MSQKKIKKIRAEVEKVVSKIVEIRDISIRKIVKENWLFLVILSLGVILLYFNSLRGDFVSDDYAAITQNPIAGEVLTVVAMGFRAFPSIVNAIVASIFGVTSSVPFHVTSLGLYIIIIWLVFLLTYVLMGRWVAIISTIIFAVLPIHVEAVSWISGKPYLLNAIGVLWGLLIFSLYDRTKKNNYIKLLLLTLPLCMYFEPVRFLAFPIIIPFLVLSVCRNSNNGTFWKWFLSGIGVLVLFILLIMSGWISNRVGMVNSGYNSSESVFYNPFFQYPTAMVKYLQLIMVPADLTLYHTMYILPVWLNWAVISVYFASLLYFFFKNKGVFFALAFIFMAAAPSMAPVKVSWLVAERYMFLGSLGFCILVALVMSNLYQKIKWVIFVPFIFLVFGYGVRVYLRNIDWQSNHNLWVNTCQVSPNSHNAWNNIGDDYDKLKDYYNAIKGFTQSTIVKPNYADAYHNRANIFYKIGRLDLARDSYQTALSYSPELYHSYLSLVQIDLAEQKLNLAFQHSQALLKLQPSNAQAWYVYGVVMAQAGDLEKAKSGFLKSLEINPQFNLSKEALSKLSGR